MEAAGILSSPYVTSTSLLALYRGYYLGYILPLCSLDAVDGGCRHSLLSLRDIYLPASVRSRMSRLWDVRGSVPGVSIPKAPFPARHNEPARGRDSAGSQAILYCPKTKHRGRGGERVKGGGGEMTTPCRYKFHYYLGQRWDM
uniref:Uncharacterized protein n=1 Tax=Oncorhynchus kisutch TaxID=8019 RepID=A0A8C7D6H9_ONCKI